MMVKKVNIDELMQLLLDMRQTAEFIDMHIDSGNTLRIRRHKTDNKPKTFEEDDDINELFI